MNHSLLTASVSLRGLQTRLDIIANNVANINTIGFKRQDASFHDILTSIKPQEESMELEGRLTPRGLVEGWGSRVSKRHLDMSQGNIQLTGISTQLAIEGQALFEIRRPQLGPDGEPVLTPDGEPVYSRTFTRNGSFQFSLLQGDDQNVYLATEDGSMVSGVDGGTIAIPRGHSMRIDAIGRVFSYNPADPNAQPIQVGRLRLMQVLRPQLLESIGNNQYVIPDEVQNPDDVLAELDVAALTGPDANISVRQGYLEQSNVNLSNEMTDMITTQRAYQLNARALSSADQMMRLTNNLRA